MGRRYKAYESDQTHFITCTVLHWIPLFTRPENVQIILNPVKRGYVDEAWHWRYSSARDYEGMEGLIAVEKRVETVSCLIGVALVMGSQRGRWEAEENIWITVNLFRY